MHHTITSYATYTQAQAAVLDLEREGFDRDQIGVVVNEETRGLVLDVPRPDNADRGAVVGGLTGLLVGGIVGLSAGPPGVVVGGYLVSLLGASLTGGLAGTLFGALAGLGIPSDQTEWFAKRVQAGDVLLSVSTGDPTRSTIAERVLERHRPTTPVATFSSE